MTRKHYLGLILAIASVCILSLYHGCGGGGGGGGTATFTATITPTQGTLITDPIQISNANHASYLYFDGIHEITIGGDVFSGDQVTAFVTIDCWLHSLDAGQYPIIMSPVVGECSGMVGAVDNNSTDQNNYSAQDDNPGTLTIATSDQNSISGSFNFYAKVSGQDEEVRVEGSFELPLITD